MIHPELWLDFVHQRQRELWAEAEHTAIVKRLTPSLFRRLRERWIDNPPLTKPLSDNEGSFQTPDGSGLRENLRQVA